MHVLSKSRNPNPLVAKLLSECNNVNAVDSAHQNALYKASKNPACDDQTFITLIDYGAELPKHFGVKKQFLTEMIMCGQLEWVRALVEYQPAELTLLLEDNEQFVKNYFVCLRSNAPTICSAMLLKNVNEAKKRPF
jgi:hypothetical protein